MRYLLFFFIGVSVLHAEQHPTETQRGAFSPSFYAFKNGVHFGSVEEEVTSLKELGYDGVSQCFRGAEPLKERRMIYEQSGLKVLSVYLNVNEKPLSADLIKPLADSGTMLELTVQKQSDATVQAVRETVELAATMDIKVALYPHAGFSIATVPQAMSLVEQVNHPNLGVMFNLCHFLHGEKLVDLEGTLESCGERLLSVSISGANVSNGKGWDDLIQPLNQGDFPLVRLLQQLKKMQYSGPVTLQSYGIKGDSYENLKNSMAIWKEALQGL